MYIKHYQITSESHFQHILSQIHLMKKWFWDNHNVDHTFLSKKARQFTSYNAYLWFSLFKMHKLRDLLLFYGTVVTCTGRLFL